MKRDSACLYLLILPKQTPLLCLLPLGRGSDRAVTVYNQIRPALRTMGKKIKDFRLSELYTCHDIFIHLLSYLSCSHHHHHYYYICIIYLCIDKVFSHHGHQDVCTLSLIFVGRVRRRGRSLTLSGPDDFAGAGFPVA